MYFMICSSSEDLTRSLYESCISWTPLYILFRPALAMYSLLNMMKLVVAS